MIFPPRSVSRALALVLLVACTLTAWRMAVAQSPTVGVILQNAVAGNANGSNATVTGYELVGVQATTSGGPPTFTLNFEGSIDGSTFVATSCRPIGGGVAVTTATAAGAWRCNTSGLRFFRARVSGYAGAGSITALATLMGAGTIATAEDDARQVGEWNIAHITSAVHIAGTIPVTVTGAVAVNQSGTWTVQAAHQAGAWNLDQVNHVKSALVHVIGTVTAEGRGTAGSPAGGVVSVQGVASGTVLPITGTVAANQMGTWTIQAAHQGGQWNVAHVTSVVHMAAASALPVVQSSQGALWNVTAHQGAAWSLDQVNHVKSALVHVIGTVTAEGRGTAGTPAGGVVSVQGVAGGTAQPVSGAVSANQSGSWTVQAAHQGGQWNVAHVTSVVHMAAASPLPVVQSPQGALWTVTAHQSGAWSLDQVNHVKSALVHVIGTVTVEGRGTAGSAAGGVVSVQGVASGTALSVSGSGTGNFVVSQGTAGNVKWPMDAHQAGVWNVAHISAVQHVVVAKDMTGTKGNQVCHSQTTFVTSANAIIAHQGAGLRIYICALFLNYTTVTVSIVEGTGAACATSPVAVFGGSTAALGLPAGTYNFMSPAPLWSTQTASNQLCVLTSASTPRVMGTLVYGAY